MPHKLQPGPSPGAKRLKSLRDTHELQHILILKEYAKNHIIDLIKVLKKELVKKLSVELIIVPMVRVPLR